MVWQGYLVKGTFWEVQIHIQLSTLCGHNPPKLSANRNLSSSAPLPTQGSQPTYRKQHKGDCTFCPEQREVSWGRGQWGFAASAGAGRGSGGAQDAAVATPSDATARGRTKWTRGARKQAAVRSHCATLRHPGPFVQSPGRVTPEPAQTGRTSGPPRTP